MFIVTDSDFVSQGERLAAWLYRPEGETRPPVIVMAHGFGGERTFRLPDYAEVFAGQGMAVLLFDYRSFGDSDGEPRNLVHPFRHLADWRAALAHVRRLPDVDGARTALWGTSYSGGHVIVTAAKDGGVRAISSQVPFVDGLASVGSQTPAFIARAVASGLWDLFRAGLNKTPYTVPIVSEPGRFGVMNGEDALNGYLNLVPEGSTWINECPARALIYTTLYRPIAYASRVRCPALVTVADNDAYIPVEAVLKAAARLPRAEVVRLPLGHFDVYLGEAFENAVRRQAEFFRRHLGVD